MSPSRRPGAETPQSDGRKKQGLGRALGLGVITGAADDDPSAIGAYGSTGAQFGLVWMDGCSLGNGVAR